MNTSNEFYEKEKIRETFKYVAIWASRILSFSNLIPIIKKNPES